MPCSRRAPEPARIANPRLAPFHREGGIHELRAGGPGWLERSTGQAQGKCQAAAAPHPVMSSEPTPTQQQPQPQQPQQLALDSAAAAAAAPSAQQFSSQDGVRKTRKFEVKPVRASLCACARAVCLSQRTGLSDERVLCCAGRNRRRSPRPRTPWNRALRLRRMQWSLLRERPRTRSQGTNSRVRAVQHAIESRLTARGSDSAKDDGADGKVQRKGRFTVIEVRCRNVHILVCARC